MSPQQQQQQQVNNNTTTAVATPVQQPQTTQKARAQAIMKQGGNKPGGRCYSDDCRGCIRCM